MCLRVTMLRGCCESLWYCWRTWLRQACSSSCKVGRGRAWAPTLFTSTHSWNSSDCTNQDGCKRHQFHAKLLTEAEGTVCLNYQQSVWSDWLGQGDGFWMWCCSRTPLLLGSLGPPSWLLWLGWCQQTLHAVPCQISPAAPVITIQCEELTWKFVLIYAHSYGTPVLEKINPLQVFACGNIHWHLCLFKVKMKENPDWWTLCLSRYLDTGTQDNSQTLRLMEELMSTLFQSNFYFCLYNYLKYNW